jgi:hypothetical protein
VAAADGLLRYRRQGVAGNLGQVRGLGRGLPASSHNAVSGYLPSARHYRPESESEASQNPVSRPRAQFPGAKGVLAPAIGSRFATWQEFGESWPTVEDAGHVQTVSATFSCG